jgi:hypothetical protein
MSRLWRRAKETARSLHKALIDPFTSQVPLSATGEHIVNETISIPADQFQRMQQQLSQLEAERAIETSSRQAAEAQALIAKGQADAVVKTFQGKIQAAEEEARTSAADNELRKTLTGYPLVDGIAVDQLATLLRDQVTADRDQSGKLVVRGKDFRPVSELVRETLSRPNFAHFLRSGASAAPVAQPQPGTSPATSRPVPEDDPNAPVGVRILNAAIRQQAAAKAAQIDPATTMSQPFGLGRRR